MARHVSLRLAQALVVLAIVTVLVFAIARLLPGDAIMAQMGGSVGVQDPEVVERVRQQFGLDQPLHRQFVVWLGNFVRGDWGTSLGTGQPVLEMFLQRLPVTLELFGWATAWSFAVGIPVGIVGAVRRGSPLDMALTTGALLGVSIPPFWLAIVLIYLLAVAWPIVPPSGYVPLSEGVWLNVQAMALPGFVLGIGSAGLLARFVRSSLLEVLSQDFIRTARAKGLTERAVVALHALKPAMIPVVTVVGLSWGGLLAGAFFVEVIFHPRPRPDERGRDLPKGFPGDAGDADRGVRQRARRQRSRRYRLRLSRPARAGAVVAGAAGWARPPRPPVLRALLRQRLAVAGLAIIALMGLMAAFAPLLAPASPYDQDLYAVLSPPSAAHWLGTDNLGRDLLSRIIYGARVSLLVGIASTALSAAAGVAVGLVAGFKGGTVDAVVMRVTDAFLCFPPLIFILVMAATLGPGVHNIVLSFAVFGWTGFARIMRGQVLLVRELPFIEACRSAGVSPPRLMWRHVLPNALAPIVVAASVTVGSAIMVEAGVSFLGVGVQPPTASWGGELRIGFTFLQSVPLFSVAPGLMISLTVVAFNFVGDGLWDLLDPRLRKGA